MVIVFRGSSYVGVVIDLLCEGGDLVRDTAIVALNVSSRILFVCAVRLSVRLILFLVLVLGE